MYKIVTKYATCKHLFDYLSFGEREKKRIVFYETGIHILLGVGSVVVSFFVCTRAHSSIATSVYFCLTLINLMNVISTNAGADTGARYNFARSMWHAAQKSSRSRNN